MSPTFSPISLGTPRNALFGVTKHNSITNSGGSMGVAVDSSGNVYSAGSWNTQVTVTKFSPTGTEIWSKMYAASTIYGTGIQIDSSNNLYIVSTVIVSASYYYNVIKIDSNGNTLWQKNIAFGAYSTATAMDSSGNIYISGPVQTTYVCPYVIKLNSSGARVVSASRSPQSGRYETAESIGVDPGQNFIVGSSGGSSDNGVLARFYSNGALHWSKQVESKMLSVATDSSSNIYCGTYTMVDAVSGTTLRRPVLMKHDVNGNILWARKILTGMQGITPYSAVKVDSSDNIYFAVPLPTGTGGNNNTSILVNKYNTSGTLLWSKKIVSGYGFEGYIGSNLKGINIALDNSNNIYISLTFGTYDSSANTNIWRPSFVKIPVDGTKNGFVSAGNLDIAVVSNTTIGEASHTSSNSANAWAYSIPTTDPVDATTVSYNTSATTNSATTF